MSYTGLYLKKVPDNSTSGFSPLTRVLNQEPVQIIQALALGKSYVDRTQSEFLRRSAFGLTAVYNSLPEHIVLLNTVKSFQGSLRCAAKRQIENGTPNWAFMHTLSYKHSMIIKGFM